ncbi:MAG: enoyl-CoA hydratase/isomerase family protein [Thermodesulfobacteriota bacterium]
MAYELIIFEAADGVATITINRPKAMNALNPQVVAELGQAIAEIEADDSIKCVVITGAGDKAFVAGADIAAMVQMTALEGRKFSLMGQEVLFKLEKLDRPVIAAVNGFALGGGTELAMACDFIYAADHAKFGQPEINLGIIPGFGGTQRLTRLVGKGWAKELCLTGAIIGAAEAKEIGLVNRVFPAAELMDAVMKTAKGIAQKGKVSTRAIKHLIDAGADMALERAMPMEAECFATCFASPDQKEGMTAFLEKRKANFTGGK